MPNQIRGPLRLTTLPIRKTTLTAVYPLLIKYPRPYRKERLGQGPPRPRLYTGGLTSPDPRGLRDGNPAWSSVQRHDGIVGDADLRTSPCLAVAVRSDRYTHDITLESQTFALSVLRDDQVDVATHFADTSGEYHDKLQGIPYGLTPGG